MSIFLTTAQVVSALPPGFVEEEVGSGWREANGLTFDGNGRMYVWERAGRVWIVENGQKRATPLVDISQEVGAWRDFGLLGFVLHPDFLSNRYIYLFYNVDRHHLMNAGTTNYDPIRDEYLAATVGRIVRYTVSPDDGYNQVDPASRRVLVGATPSDGCLVTFTSHGTGTILFGADGTLIASCGDGASWRNPPDTGNIEETYFRQALADGILRPKENVGAFRAQLIDSLSGKLWRIDAETGLGVPSNPFYDPNEPGSKASRVWALGMRNPYRMTLRPGTGSSDPAAGDPGTIYLGDVGWTLWEDLHVVKRGGQNLGWPIYEGMEMNASFGPANVENSDAPNPAYDGVNCTRRNFFFRELLIQETQSSNPGFPNPCGGLITTVPTFVHSAPEVDWRRGVEGPARTKAFVGGVFTPTVIGSPGSTVAGANFGGNASTGGVWIAGRNYPAAYQDRYFHADYGAGWIRSFTFDANDQPTAVELFHEGADGVVHLATDPMDGDLYYVSWRGAVRRVRWVGTSRPPKAVAASDVRFGPTPLVVQFSGRAEVDASGLPVSYAWDFGDGTTSTLESPVHTFSVSPGQPTAFSVTLTVTDSGGLKGTTTLPIWVENSPPSVEIVSPAAGTTYPLEAPTQYPLQANLWDAEQRSDELTCAWQLALHHNDHVHTEPVDPRCNSSVEISPAGCDGDTYFYTVSLTVTDSLGLATSSSVALYPRCPN